MLFSCIQAVQALYIIIIWPYHLYHMHMLAMIPQQEDYTGKFIIYS
jgi:hypothetical protein